MRQSCTTPLCAGVLSQATLDSVMHPLRLLMRVALLAGSQVA